MKTILLVLMIGCALPATAQVDWHKTSDWKIYKVLSGNTFAIPLDSLSRFNSRRLQQDTVLGYIAESKILPDSINPVWMGAWVSTYRYDGQVHKIQISAYGGFFYDQSSGRYYQIPMERKDDWMNYINRTLSTL